MRILCRSLLVVSFLVSLAAPAGAAGTPTPVDPVDYQALAWRNVGPFRGGRVTAVAGVVQKPSTFYFGSTGGGVWKTVDAGVTWKNVSDGQFQTGSVGAIAVAPSDPNVVYVGMGEAPVRGVTTSSGDGVYRSTDGGATWTHLGLERTRHISRIRIHPRNPDLVYVAAQGTPYAPSEERGIYRSTDGGASWTRIHFASAGAGASDLAMDPSNPRVLYAAYWQLRRLPWKIESGGTEGGLFKTTDGGESWEKLTEGLPEEVGKIGVAVSPARPRRVWAMIEAEEGGLFRSDDAGASWRRVNRERVLRARAWYYTHVIADPVDADTVYVLNAPMMRSVDGGTTFSRVRSPHGDNHALWIHPRDPRRMINGNDGGATVSVNGGATWSTQGNQPTGQFYRVATDRQFPYRIYGGQQDNSTVSIPHRTFGRGIGREDWYPVSGCESAHIAFDPDHPRYVYAGCYQGLIGEWDAETRRERSIMAYEVLGLGADPRDLPYRFNWNAPIMASPHDPAILYHAANRLLMTRDRGLTWTEISPDLTRDEEEKQGPGGGPITNEAAGGETYNTILAVAASPHAPGTLWTGSDDGLVHLTRDGGATWKDVTPPGLGEAMINSIEISPHAAGTAYVVAMRYKFDDFAPRIFRTRDFGEHWRSIVGGIAPEAFARVVREDPERPGLLYAGTETGAYVSFDDGAAWQSLQLELPVVPITDMEVHGDDLVISTQGRGFWVLDDLTPLREALDAPADRELRLFTPEAAYRMGGSSPAGRGANPPNGAVLYYALGRELSEEETLELEILDDAGRVVRSYSSHEPSEEEEPTPDASSGFREEKLPKVLPTEVGLNRFVWDLRREEMVRVPGLFVFGDLRGPRVGPGVYTARLTLGETTVSRSFEVLDDPRAGIAAEEFEPQQALLETIASTVDAVHEAVNALRAVKQQAEALVERTASHPAAAEIRAAGEALTEAIETWEAEVVQAKQETFQDVINFPSRLDAQLLDLLRTVDASGPPVTQGARRRWQDLERAWEERRAARDRVLHEELAAFNALFDAQRIPAVILPDDVSGEGEAPPAPPRL